MFNPLSCVEFQTLESPAERCNSRTARRNYSTDGTVSFESSAPAFAASAVNPASDVSVGNLLDGLTEPQQEAVEYFEGPLQILAGPGSGKTRVITRRIARLVDRGVHPSSILAITFTNKAAREMQERVNQLLPDSRIWISTFHRFCASVLRRRGRSVGLESNFVIFDKSDQLQVLRHVLNDLDMDSVRVPVARLGARISHIKNTMISSEEFSRSLDMEVGEPFDMVVAQVYPKYQETLLASNAVDFDDLLLHVVKLFQENPTLRAEYDDRFRFLLVDEYQDTNAIQYSLVRSLGIDRPNVCVTGDPDQSIYAWRGANIENILNFERDFENAKLVRLEQNFRSTALILQSADQLISHNRMRKAKSLTTDAEDGESVQLLKFKDGRSEADGIAELIRKQCTEEGSKWGDFAIFYRVNSMSRELELAFTRHHIPFQVAAGLAFYDRAEVRDLLAYLRLIENPVDTVAFARVVNRPARGIGKTSQNKVTAWATENGVGPMEAARQADKIDGLTKSAKVKLKAFIGMMDTFSLANAGSVSDLLKKIVEKTAYSRTWMAASSEQAITKQANVEELVNAAAQYDEANADDPSITGFLETTALASDVDSVDAEAGKVTLMTIHAAKGLEFPSVVIVGLEHGLIPHERSIKSNDPKQLEEERRLLFVGMTRAMRNLYMTTAQVRAERGTPRITIPSTFLAETTYDIIDENNPDGGKTQSGVSSKPDKKQELRDRLKASLAAGNKPLLTTGAALLNGTGDEVELPNVSSSSTFAIGMRVRHPKYGMGTVTHIAGFAKRRTVEVEFASGNRTETFSASHCPLQPIGVR
jgi:DNA helicase II / ATP-dependent DNA helicase PcrA